MAAQSRGPLELARLTLSDELTYILKDVHGQWTTTQLLLFYIIDAGHSSDYLQTVLPRMIDPLNARRYLE